MIGSAASVSIKASILLSHSFKASEASFLTLDGGKATIFAGLNSVASLNGRTGGCFSHLVELVFS